MKFNPLTGNFDLTGVTDHGLLSGLTDDDHTQYALLAGRAGGQTLIGGTGAGETLILQSTSHATRGAIIISDWIEVGTATDSATTGDAVFGLTGAARMFYDQSVPILYLYTPANAISDQISQVAGTDTVFNEGGADINYRWESVGQANALVIDGGTAFVGIGTQPSYPFDARSTLTNNSGTQYGEYHAITCNPSSAPAGTTYQYGSYYGAQPTGANQNSSMVIYGLVGDITNTATAGIGNLAAGYFGITFMGTASGTSASVSGFRAFQNIAGGTVTNLYGIYLDTAIKSGSGTITNCEAIRIASVNAGGTTNYAIVTGTGLLQFGDALLIDGSADRVQLTLQANATQTNNIFVIENSSATDLLVVSGTGLVGIGIVPLSALHVGGTTAITRAGGSGNSYGLLTVGTQGTSGGSLWVNIPSLNASYSSGFSIDGSYSNPGGVGTAISQLKAWGVESAGGYDSAIAFFTEIGTTSSEKMRIDSAGIIWVKLSTGYIDFTTITAGNPNIKINATTDTPTAAWGAGVGNEVSTTPAGWMEINVGGNARYIPYWA